MIVFWFASVVIAFLLGRWWHGRMLAREIAAMKAAMWNGFVDNTFTKDTE